MPVLICIGFRFFCKGDLICVGGPNDFQITLITRCIAYVGHAEHPMKKRSVFKFVSGMCMLQLGMPESFPFLQYQEGTQPEFATCSWH